MTAIAALVENGKIWIGGDSAGVSPDSLSLNVRKDPKVFIKEGFVFGFTTSFRMGNLLKWSLQIPDHATKMSDECYLNTSFVESVRACFSGGGYSKIESNEESGGEFVFGYNKQLYKMYGDYQIAMPADNFTACGCGGQICLGSLYSSAGKAPLKRIELALQAAERFSGGVRGPFTIINV